MITTLKTSAHPIENVPFPTVTICGSGLHMDNVEKAVADNFAQWRDENGRNETSEEEISEDMAIYMNEAFQINTESSEAANILDMLNTMVASDVDVSVGLNGVRDNVIACAETENDIESTNSRKKRNTEDKLETDEFCCEKMQLTIDLEALGVSSDKMGMQQMWSGLYTFSDEMMMVMQCSKTKSTVTSKSSRKDQTSHLEAGAMRTL